MYKKTNPPVKTTDLTGSGSGSRWFDAGCESCIKLKVKSLGVVELRSLLVHPLAVNTSAEVAFVHPVLQHRQ